MLSGVTTLPSYHPMQMSGLGGSGSSLDKILSTIAKREKQAQKHETKIAPYTTEAFAVQAASQHAAVQADLTAQVAFAELEHTSQAMSWLPWALGGVGVMITFLVVFKTLTKKGGS